MEKHRSQGEAMHYTYLSMPEGDSRRHKKRCVNFKKGICLCKDNTRCIGSAFCEEYKEKAVIESSPLQNFSSTNKISKGNLNDKIYKIFICGKNSNLKEN